MIYAAELRQIAFWGVGGRSPLPLVVERGVSRGERESKLSPPWAFSEPKVLFGIKEHLGTHPAGCRRAFQKRNIHTTLIGGLIEENESLYFHGKKNAKVNEIIYEIPVTNEEYNNIYNYIETVKNDKEYIFNYISCWLMFPIHGIKSYKALHCTEFLCEVLKYKTSHTRSIIHTFLFQ